ncbi:MAG: alpha amylase C-terminal domain-containing protein, partial [Pseudomonadota bacterium]
EIQHKLYAFARSDKDEIVLVATNFSSELGKTVSLTIPEPLISHWELNSGHYTFTDRLSEQTFTLVVNEQQGNMTLDLPPLACRFLSLKR